MFGEAKLTKLQWICRNEEVGETELNFHWEVKSLQIQLIVLMKDNHFGGDVISYGNIKMERA